jgi:hypothetical protein
MIMRYTAYGLPTEPDGLVIRLRLSELCQSKQGLNLRQLADKLSLPYAQVLRWNQGKHLPPLRVFLLLLSTLQCGVDELIQRY